MFFIVFFIIGIFLWCPFVDMVSDIIFGSDYGAPL